MSVWITPAGAGKTAVWFFWWFFGSDHPRRCGENSVVWAFGVRQMGSPPQVRGKPAALDYLPIVDRITPAGAGKTPSVTSVLLAAGDHPRRCGENNRGVKHLAFCPGSPPQVRGKPVPENESNTCCRITPAGAGKTLITTQKAADAKDHPRRCGEN